MLQTWAFLNLILGVVSGFLGFIAMIIFIIFLALKYKSYSIIMPLITFSAGIPGSLLFWVTQDMRLPMAITDSWTYVHVAILVFQLTLIIISLVLIPKHRRPQMRNTAIK